MTHVAVLFIVAYLAGSVSFSIVLFKILGKDDPRNMFSGNAGVMNVYRQAGFFTAALVLLLDMARAMAIALVATLALPSDFVPWICLGLILGNRFPCFHNFRGKRCSQLPWFYANSSACFGRHFHACLANCLPTFRIPVYCISCHGLDPCLWNTNRMRLSSNPWDRGFDYDDAGLLQPQTQYS